jgi:energy-coupling factor transporter transmembrane protein EcfT
MKVFFYIKSFVKYSSASILIISYFLVSKWWLQSLIFCFCRGEKAFCTRECRHKEMLLDGVESLEDNESTN